MKRERMHRKRVVLEQPYIKGVPKISHYQVSSLNRIKIAIKAKLFFDFDYKMSKKI